MELFFFLFWILAFSAFRRPAKSTAGWSVKIGPGDAVGWSKKNTTNYVIIQAALCGHSVHHDVFHPSRETEWSTHPSNHFFLSWLFKPAGSSLDLWMKKSEQVSFRLSVIQNPVLHVLGCSFFSLVFFFKSVFHPSATSEHSPQPKNQAVPRGIFLVLPISQSGPGFLDAWPMWSWAKLVPRCKLRVTCKGSSTSSKGCKASQIAASAFGQSWILIGPKTNFIF